MTARHLIPAALLTVAFIFGTLSDRVSPRPPLYAGGYRVLAADFHVHTFPLSASTLTPWDIVMEARHQGLDAIAVTGHNEVVSGQIARWFSERIGGPTVIVGEEIHGPHFHMIAAGIHHTISWRLTASQAVDEIHRQDGVAIAAHPGARAWPAFDRRALAKLDAAEVVQPAVYAGERHRRDLELFYERAHVTAIGSSDFHGNGRLGLCRTYVFARDNTAPAILEALRAGRTVVADRGRVYGDPALIPLIPHEVPRGPDLLSCIAGLAGLLGFTFLLSHSRTR